MSLLALEVVIVFKYDTLRVDDPQAALELNRLQLLRVSRLRRNGTRLNARPSSKTHQKHQNIIRRTLARLSALIRPLLPTLWLGKPTTPTVTLCAALGLYALRSQSNAGRGPCQMPG
jgi:hypothetical protein